MKERDQLKEDWTDKAEKGGEWIPRDYSPELTVEDWRHLLQDGSVFDETGLEIMKRIRDYGGQATCTQLSTRYGRHANFYNAGSSSLARRVAHKTGCPLPESDKWWPILYVGRYAYASEEGSFVWKLRDELAHALETLELSEADFQTALADHVNGQVARFERIEHVHGENNHEPYDRETFLSEVYMTGEAYDRLVGVLRHKQNIILQGAPGVGKTFAARRLAYAMMGEKDERRIEFVQFHQNYSYEDFVMGYRPSADGFTLSEGVFYRFCERAANDKAKDYFFIIDEINRGNMSKIFGELLMLIEKDYRGSSMTLAYEGRTFTVPKNLYIIGMMNTADRSLALIDYALRRRFSFFDIDPGFDAPGFITYADHSGDDSFARLLSKVKELNEDIAEDPSLGRGFRIGHSYFCGQSEIEAEWLRSVIDYDLLPTLREYWFDDLEKLEYWERALRGVLR